MFSFPEQHYANGVAKNEQTGRSFKSIVRILKNARGRLIEKGLISADLMPSFFLECLVWNAPDSCFANDTWRADAEAVTLNVWQAMQNSSAQDYAEVCDLRRLFRGTDRTPAQASEFMRHAWDFIQ